MSRNQYKKLQRLKKWDETKTEYRKIKKQKKKAAAARRKEMIKKGEMTEEEAIYHQARKPRALPKKQIPTDVKIIMDCEFDDLMNHKEIVSMSNQVTRSYSAKRHCKYDVDLKISSFNKNLKARFDKSVSQYKLWQNIDLLENEKLSDILPMDSPEELAKYVYLTADTDEVIQELQPGHTYIIGGIVDKNRHKKLCLNKAKELGLKVGKLPIDKYIELNGREVLATSHVYELCCKWFESGKDWGKAFNDVLPPQGKDGEEDEDEDEDDDDDEVDEHEDEEDDEKEEESGKDESTNDNTPQPEVESKSDSV
ncbi:guanine-1-methyltransferase-domain-containing protein [Scheffersomyces xylosifermentans]|uniref:guanine-1-methyltransferase-domain-containing protein n=1 Tax=Scheffersomyces xylosifermentans TaxID=1304137 RepID=UPI00315DF0BB